MTSQGEIEEIKRRLEELNQENLDLRQSVEALTKSEEYYRNLAQNSEREAELLDQKQRLESLIHHSGLAIVTLDREHRIASINRRFRDLFGYSLAEIEGRDLDEILAGSENIELAKQNTRTTMEGQPIFGFGKRRRADGVFIDVDVVGVPVVVNGLIVGAYGIYRDVSELIRTRSQLEEKDTLHRAIFETTHDAVFLMKDDKIIECNRAALEVYGAIQTDLINRTPADFSPPYQADGRSSREKAAELIERAYAGEYLVFEWLHLRPNGTSFDAEVILNKVELADGDYLHVAVRDITARKAAQKALQDSRERYKAFFENSMVGIVRSLFEDSRIIDCNETLARILGYRGREDMIQKCKLEDHYVKPDQRRLLADAILREGRLEGWELELKRLDGTAIWIEISSTYFRDKGYVESTVIDVTKKQRARLALVDSERRYRELFNNISDLLVTHDIEGRLRDVNPAVIRAFGYSAEEIIGRRLDEFMPAQHHSQVSSNYIPNLLAKGYMDGIFLVIAKDGTEKYIEYRITLVKQAGSEPYATGVGRDVTERIMAQREVKALQEQLHQAQKMQAVGTLASGIAHDFNNILQAVSGFIELLQAKGGLDQTSQRYINEVVRFIERASSLITRLLTFSRKVKPELTAVDLNREIDEALTILKRTLPKMIAIETNLDPDLGNMKGDASQVEQIILNLAGNSRDAMTEGGRLLFETENIEVGEAAARNVLEFAPGSYVLLRVSDTGSGIKPETMAHMYEPFFTTKKIGEGTGLGLATVYGIVKSHGGQIFCQSRLGQGAVFEIYFPAMASESTEPGGPDPDRVEIPTGAETILLVDDEEAILEAGAEFLSNHGYTVHLAGSGEEALEIYQAKSRDVGLVILDVGMPGMGGLACLDKLKEVDPKVKVIIATGYLSPHRSELEIRPDGVELVSKPYRLADMLKKIREVLDS